MSPPCRARGPLEPDVGLVLWWSHHFLPRLDHFYAVGRSVPSEVTVEGIGRTRIVTVTCHLATALCAEEIPSMCRVDVSMRPWTLLCERAAVRGVESAICRRMSTEK